MLQPPDDDAVIAAAYAERERELAELDEEYAAQHKPRANGAAIDARSLYWTLDDIAKLEPPDWLVEGLIPRGAKVLNFGESGGYKTILMVDMFCRAAHSMDYHGLATITCPLVYIANEDRYGLAVHHVQGWHAYHGKPAGRVIVLKVDVKLDQPADVQKILSAAADAFPEERPVFVIDTWDRSLNGDQNQTADVNPGLNALDALLAVGEATVVNSHSPWGDKSRTKGSVTFWANHDTRLKSEKDETTKRGTLTVKHHKHGKDGLVLTFDFEVYEIEGKTGAKISTLIPRRIYDAPAQAAGKPNGRARDQLNDGQSIALMALREEADSARRWDFSFADAQALWVRRGAIDSEQDEEAKRNRAHRLRQQLAKRRLIKLDGQLIRLILPS